MAIVSIIIALVGAAFCFVMAGAVHFERPGVSSEEDMRELFDIAADHV